jgi:peptide/nickel transport system substrate-binding protein
MPKKKKEVKQPIKQSSLSMKEALSSIVVKEKPTKEKVHFKDWFWNYPVFLIRTFKKLIPLSYIVVFAIFGVFLSVLLQSDSFAQKFMSGKNSSSLVEGFVGISSTLNPLFATVNDVDESLQNLIFEKLIDMDTQGNPVANIAKSWNVSDDGLTYDFVIQDGLYWSDGEELTVDDVIFTIETGVSLYEEYGYDSVVSSLTGIEVQKVGDDTVRFILDEENPSFFEVVSFYIVPKHRLEDVDLVDIPFNIFAKYPIGSGKYVVVRNDDTSISLKDSEYDNIEPNVQNITFRMYSDYSALEGAFRNGVLDSFGVFDINNVNFISEYDSGYSFYSKSLELRNKMIFLNNRSGTFESKNMRVGINYLIDVSTLLERSEILGIEILGPIAESSWAFNDDIVNYSYNLEKATEAFKAVGYVMNENSGYFESEDGEILSFTLSYFKNDLNERLVSTLEEMLLEQGVVLRKEPLNYSQISQEIIATRNFEMLLYEVETMIDPDQYNLWHSLKTNYPDLNISGYEYERVDILLEEARITRDRKERKEKYDLFQKYLMDDAPVVFLYHPQYTYVVDANISGVDLESIKYPYQRFDNIEDWIIN